MPEALRADTPGVHRRSLSNAIYPLKSTMILFDPEIENTEAPETGEHDLVSEIRSCRGCHRPIRFLHMPSGASMPVETVKRTVLALDPKLKLVIGGQVTTQPRVGENGWLPHWVGCEARETFHSKKKSHGRK